jgi:hypothetical protein
VSAGASSGEGMAAAAGAARWKPRADAPGLFVRAASDASAGASASAGTSSPRRRAARRATARAGRLTGGSSATTCWRRRPPSAAATSVAEVCVSACVPTGAASSALCVLCERGAGGVVEERGAVGVHGRDGGRGRERSVPGVGGEAGG